MDYLLTYYCTCLVIGNYVPQSVGKWMKKVLILYSYGKDEDWLRFCRAYQDKLESPGIGLELRHQRQFPFSRGEDSFLKKNEFDVEIWWFWHCWLGDAPARVEGRTHQRRITPQSNNLHGPWVKDDRIVSKSTSASKSRDLTTSFCPFNKRA